MKILSIDTASNICGVSILEDSNLICKFDSYLGTTHSENLMPMIGSALEQSHLSLQDMDLLVCDKGPGSFTGIRIGLATVKAFQDALEIPCIGVNSLESLAYLVPQEGFIVSFLDCKKDNCYFAFYEKKDENYNEIIPPSADTIENAFALCKERVSHPNIITFVGDFEPYKNNLQDIFRDHRIAFSPQNNLDSYSLGLAGFKKWKEKKMDDVLPLYLKKPQAQRQLEKKLEEIEISPMTLEHFYSISETLTLDFDEFWNPSLLKDELTSPNSKYIVAKSQGHIVGFAGIKILMEEADLMNIVVKKDRRNQGIGHLLLTHLIDLSKSLHLNSITLEVMEENYPAIHLYKEFGFQTSGIRKNYYQNKNGILMKRSCR